MRRRLLISWTTGPWDYPSLDRMTLEDEVDPSNKETQCGFKTVQNSTQPGEEDVSHMLFGGVLRNKMIDVPSYLFLPLHGAHLLQLVQVETSGNMPWKKNTVFDIHRFSKISNQPIPGPDRCRFSEHRRTFPDSAQHVYRGARRNGGRLCPSSLHTA